MNNMDADQIILDEANFDVTNVLACGECGSPMILKETLKFPNPDGSPRKFYGCSNFPECRGTHAAHQNSGKPMGIPADKETKLLRMKAHEIFDQLWKKYGYRRKEAYKLLQTVMGMTEKEAHIANFNKEQCETLIRKVSAIL